MCVIQLIDLVEFKPLLSAESIRRRGILIRKVLASLLDLLACLAEAILALAAAIIVSELIYRLLSAAALTHFGFH